VSRPRFYAPESQQSAGRVALPADEAHHLLHVLRLGVGAEIGIFDGRGGEWLARVLTASKRDGVTAELTDPMRPAAEPPVTVTLAMGILKGDQMDAVIRDATMLGVSAITPLLASHVVVPSRAWKSEAARERWRRVAIASAKQCRRAVVPAIEPAASVEELLERAGFDARLITVEPAGQTTGGREAPIPAGPATALLLVGPEGGWSPAEIALARQRGVQTLSLGPRTLRAETAPMVALSSLWTVWGWG
jgi:16S rRNA (uracil1498-N3)-methyltransferase